MNKASSQDFSKIWLSVKNRLSFCWQSIFKVFCLWPRFFQKFYQIFLRQNNRLLFCGKPIFKLSNRLYRDRQPILKQKNRLWIFKQSIIPCLSQNVLNWQNHLKTGYDIFNNRLFSQTTDCQLWNNRLLILKSVRYLILDCCIIGYWHTDDRLCRRISGQIFSNYKFEIPLHL